MNGHPYGRYMKTRSGKVRWLRTTDPYAHANDDSDVIRDTTRVGFRGRLRTDPNGPEYFYWTERFRELTVPSDA